MSASKILSHRDLIVWQKAVEAVDMVYDVTANWPKHELFGLVSQVRRASVSVPSNIAEGNGRNSTRDYLNFLGMSYGSLMELDTQLHIARRRKYIDEAQELAAMARLNEIGRMINGLQASLTRRLKP